MQNIFLAASILITSEEGITMAIGKQLQLPAGNAMNFDVEFFEWLQSLGIQTTGQEGDAQTNWDLIQGWEESVNRENLKAALTHFKRMTPPVENNPADIFGLAIYAVDSLSMEQLLEAWDKLTFGDTFHQS